MHYYLLRTKITIRFLIIIYYYLYVSGDEILAVNNKPLHGLSHREAIAVFKEIKLGEMALHIGRRVPKRTRESVKSMRSPWKVSIRSHYCHLLKDLYNYLFAGIYTVFFYDFRKNIHRDSHFNGRCYYYYYIYYIITFCTYTYNFILCFI